MKFLSVTLCLLICCVSDALIQQSALQRGSGPKFELEAASVGDISAYNVEQTPSFETAKRRVAVLLCPAQFCVPEDYTVMFENLRALEDQLDIELAESCRTVPLGRTDWIKVARQLPTKNFIDANLDVKETLQWYFDAIEDALMDIFQAEGPDVSIAIVGHSIGGWVARAYLGGLSQSSSAVYRLAIQQCTSLVTLGTPHTSPDDALVDQTRGLLRAIEEAPACSPKYLTEEKGISITCVCSNAVKGSFPSTNLEELIAVGSYVPLTGMQGDYVGDGIVPSSLAFLDGPAESVIVDTCSQTGKDIRHIHVIPTPWNLWDPKAPSIPLSDDFPSYVSTGVVEQWAAYIR